jgi:hypothetical protein
MGSRIRLVRQYSKVNRRDADLAAICTFAVTTFLIVTILLVVTVKSR